MPRSNHVGFTIIELMITVVVIGILAAIATPSFADLLERNRIKGAAEAIKSELQFARSEAIKRSCDTAVEFTTGSSWQTEASCNGTSIKLMNATSSKVSLPATTFTSDIVEFRFRRGEANQDNAGVTILTDNYALQIRVVNSRVIDICYPVDAKAIAGFGACA